MINIFYTKHMFITSDFHLFHDNIIKYCKRPYGPGETDKMNEDILRKVDALPDTCETVIWYLGDLCFGRGVDKNSLPKLKEMVNRMKGAKRTLAIVTGNHDKHIFRLFKNQYKSLAAFFQDLGFDFVYNCPIFFNENTVFSHEPLYLKPGSGLRNFHGHIHNSVLTEDYFEPKKIDLHAYKNVCYDANNYEILNLRHIL